MALTLTQLEALVTEVIADLEMSEPTTFGKLRRQRRMKAFADSLPSLNTATALLAALNNMNPYERARAISSVGKAKVVAVTASASGPEKATETWKLLVSGNP